MNKVPYRIRASQLSSLDSTGPRQRHHEVWIGGRNLEDALTDQLFMDVRSNINPFDKVEIVGYHDTSFGLATQIVVVRIGPMPKDKLKARKVSFWIQEPIREMKFDVEDVEIPKEPVKLDVVRGFQCYNVIDIKSEAVLESFKTKKEANDWAVNQDPNFEAAA
jgi:hypothetical protein